MSPTTLSPSIHKFGNELIYSGLCRGGRAPAMILREFPVQTRKDIEKLPVEGAEYP